MTSISIQNPRSSGGWSIKSTFANDIVAAALDNKIQHLKYSGMKKGFTFVTNVEQQKSTYQAMLALTKKTDHVAYDPTIRVHNFLNSISDHLLSLAYLSDIANPDKYDCDFDTTNQVLYQQEKQYLQFVNVQQGASTTLTTKDNNGDDFEMLTIFYFPQQWTKLTFAHKAIMRMSVAPGGCLTRLWP